MASYRRIEAKPIAGALGAEIASVDLGKLDDETFREVEAAWLEHLVVFFRNQTLTPEQQIAFAKRFGEIHYHPFMKGMDEHPEILEIVKEEGDTRVFGEVWHTDQMFNPKPAKATILYAKETPDAGGDTLFANMYLAYDALSDPMKEMLKGIKTSNVGDRKILSRSDEIGSTKDGRYAGNEKMAAKVRDPGDVQTESTHPLVRTHPETGRKALYISNHTQTLDGFERAEARPTADTCIFGKAWATATETVERREAPLRVESGGSIASPSIIGPQSIFTIPHGLQKRDGFPWRC